MTHTAAPANHPARYTPAILQHLQAELHTEALTHTRPLQVLDPFAGVGTIHQLATPDHIHTVGIELEPEWAHAHPRTIVGDATRLPFPARTFDAVATSPAYGNRMADQYDGRDGSRRSTYRLSLGRPLHPRSGAALQWGTTYRQLHTAAWHETYRVLRPGGLFLLNIKDHIRKGRPQRVPGWHLQVATTLGFHLEHIEVIPTPGMRHGANHQARVDHELVATLRKPRSA